MFRSNNIQAMRGIAALIVVLMHYYLGMGGLLPDAPPAFARLTKAVTSFGPAGVDIFFVISGFIIFNVARNAVAETGHDSGLRRSMAFALARVARIYPVYWIVFALSLLLYLYLGGAGYVFEKWQPSRAGLLLLSQKNDVVQVAWTLAFEMYFYAVMTVLILFGPRWFLPMALVWCALQIAIVAGWYFVPSLGALAPSLYGSVLTGPQTLEFVFGIGAALLVPTRPSASSIIAVILGAILFGIGCSHALRIMQTNIGGFDSVGRVLWYGVPAALIIYGLVGFEYADLRLPAVLTRLGNMSYSLYLVHLALFNLLHQLGLQSHVLQHIPLRLAPLLGVAIAIAFTAAFYAFIELPLHRLGRRLVKLAFPEQPRSTGREGSPVGVQP